MELPHIGHLFIPSPLSALWHIVSRALKQNAVASSRVFVGAVHCSVESPVASFEQQLVDVGVDC